MITQHSSALFTDTRAYNGGVAGGTVTVAYANGNNTGTIRKPLIVLEGYDISRALNSQRYNYNYNSFTNGIVFGGINVFYTDGQGQSAVQVNFNDQLSDVGQYDLIFLDYDNGTDYMQRNAYLAERLIQWVNDTKQPLNGVRQQNVVMSMSMSGLVARYTLRDMEVRRAANPNLPAHDTRLYISHEAPHQGANVPLGFQYMVKSVADIRIYGLVKLGTINPELGRFAQLLEEPATQQLLIYQTDPRGGNLHNAWLSEYSQLGYPQQCRNVATSGGSECGQPQVFAPYAQLLKIQGSGLLDSQYSGLANGGNFLLGALTGVGAAFAGAGPIGLLVGMGVGVILALGDYEGSVDFEVHALPSQQQRNIFHGRFNICKDIVFGWFTTCLLEYEDSNVSETYLLAYDSAPGGTYDINQVRNGALSQISSSIPVAGVGAMVQPTFCFVPTTSALDIGNNSVALAPQDLTASYTNTAFPAVPRNTPFANFITGVRQNLTHILWNGQNSKWVFREMEQVPQNGNCLGYCQATFAITGDNAICAGGTTYSVSGLPAGTTVTWFLTTAAGVTSDYSYNTPTFTTAFTGSGSVGPGTLTATIESECGRMTVTRRIYIGPPAPVYFYQDAANSDYCRRKTAFIIGNYDPGLQYTLTGAPPVSPTGTFSVRGLFRQVFTLTVRNACGSLSRTDTLVYEPCGQRYYAAYPNPADDALTVEQTDSTGTQRTTARGAAIMAASSSAAPGTLYTVRLFDSYGVQQVQQATATPTVQLATGSLPTGLYLLHIEVGGVVVERRRLQITH